MLTSSFNIDFKNDMFKFRSLHSDNAEKYITDIIVNNRLYAPKISELNDHIESTLLYDDSTYNELVVECGLIITHIMLNRISSNWQEKRCVSVSKFDLSIDQKINLLIFFFSKMWGMYSDKGEGICLVIENDQTFKKIKYETGIVTLFKNNNNQKSRCITILKNILKYWIIKKGRINDHMEQRFLQIVNPYLNEKLYEKNMSWDKEFEYRKEPNILHSNFVDVKIKGVVLGPKYKKIDWFENLLVSENIPVIKFEPHLSGVSFSEYP